MYKVYEAEKREECYKNYTSDPYFKALCRKAYKKGFRHATLSEVHSGAGPATVHSVDLYCWAGGLWVKN